MKSEGRDRLRVWDWHVHIAIFKIDNQKKTQLYSTGSAKYSVITLMGKEFENGYLHAYA